jgi:RNA polymerase sigma factor (sigma-70 family)
MMEESKLIRAAQHGDVQSFNEVVRVYQSLAYHAAYRLLGDREAAADATQEAFVSAYKHLGSFRGGSFRYWLLRIVTNCCYDQLRSRQRRPTTSLDALASEPEEAAPIFRGQHEEAPEGYAERRELGETIQKGLHILPVDQRLTLVLSDIDGLSYQEIADLTGSNMGTVKSRLARARAHLREFLLAQELLVPLSYERKPKIPVKRAGSFSDAHLLGHG